MAPIPDRRWFRFSLRESFLALTAIACAMGWAHERSTRPTGVTVDQAIQWMGDSEKVRVDCRDVESERVGSDGSKSMVTERVMHWLVRERKELPND